MEDMREKALKAFGSIFSNQESILIDGVECHLERTLRANLRFFDTRGENRPRTPTAPEKIRAVTGR